MKISLEDKDLDAIASAVAAKITAKTGTKDDATETEEVENFDGETEEESTLTRDDVREVLSKLAKKTSTENAVAVMKKAGGTNKLSELAEDKFAAVKTAVEKALKAK